MEPTNAAQQILPEKSQRRASFSFKAIRSLSISSQRSHLSISSDTGVSSSETTRRRTLRKIVPPGPHKKEGLIRNDSTSTEDSAGRDSTSTQPTTPSMVSRSTSIRGDPGPVIKSGALQPESSILKPKKEYLVLTSSTLFKFRSRAAAEQQFPVVSIPEQGLNPLTPIGSHASLKDLSSSTDISVPLEKVVSVFKDEGTRPSFGLEIWWKSSNVTHVFTSLKFDFHLPDERDDWLKQIRQAAKTRARALGEERAPSEIEAGFTLILDAKNENDSLVDIYPVVPRRPYTRLAGEPKKNWRESSSFYLAFTKYSVLLAQFSGSSKVNPSLVRLGLITLCRVRVDVNDERFDLVFRLPLDQPQTLKLSSRYHRNILSKLFKADTYLKPAWPLWTRREVFYMDDDTQQIPLPNGEDYGGFRTTLEAFIEGYHCQSVEWSVKWKDVPHAPQFCLLEPRGQSRISFRNIDFSSLSNKFDNTQRLESIIWLSRTGKRSLTRSEVDMVEHSPVLFQELISILLGSESIKHIDLTNVLRQVPTISLPQNDNSSSARIEVCEIMPPVILLWMSSQTRCNSITLNGNAIGEANAIELYLSGWKLNFETLCGVMKYLELDESNELRRLSLNNCALTGELATGIFCRIGTGRDIHLSLNGNPLETGSTDWIDLIHGNEAPSKLHLDMIHFQQESTFNRLLTALSHNKTIEFLSMVGTGPPGRVSSKTLDLLSEFFRTNETLKFLDLSGYSGKLEDGQLGWGLSGALSGLKDNTSLRQLRLQNHDIAAAEDLTELCRILVGNKGLAMFDIRHNNFDHHQFGELVQALNHNPQLISFPISQADYEYAISKEKRLFIEMQGRSATKKQDKLSKSAESRLDGALTRLSGCWESEAQKAKRILERNRDNPANQTLELQSEYLEAWGDEDLPPWVWLASKTTQQDKGKRRASELSIVTSGDLSPSLTGFSPVLFRRDSHPPHKTYVIEEEK
ncbi:hypothetical protein E0Z10_g1005 [Xylaria hypoxylon]|uniref:PH domain-containing protein n=1 Tax=Xylaria hypoxylon TaxID=37992 RepID=A0A4Z0YUX4_9PEZI|nr:hypothetical protein E0Z10_g1005 [Xylaria hypoxylon]